ncbi:aspartyl-tRNA(Asn)/glutamyl-tRNA(Gln) amidotransferase subunit A [Nonomuraea polychroma]|uniref:Aspartyl-tRNA(Asn)/glutamyl-tRNA(Gln) amidotransferase subunit A n=1 Tax=Nonomuraea polychroma TaxID=46176 RepID=A0A438M3L7_9ACTN|nr:amidase [Nonomuraea polychroma]RVX40394.1 aspartyl-tRNA(Asn)/glutamyl-tRNA(Gln) amidotransferase subunit A [Nonomuraea polychroma]
MALTPGPLAGTPGPFSGRHIAGLAQDLRRGHATSAELAEQALDAIAALGPELNAFVTVDAAGARAAARRADAELAAGTDRGPLHGIPVAVKDLIMIAGLRVTMGSRHFAGHVPEADAACVARLRRAGAVIVGTTTTHEFAYGPTGDRSASGPAHNPWDPSRMTGGSSAGSGAAVAAGLVPLALGTDTGGSVRIPAALCGVAGFKPAYDAIPADGVFPLSRTLDHVGVLAGTAEDCLLASTCLTEPTGRKHATPPTGGADRPDVVGPVRVAWLDPAGLFDGDPRVVRAVRAAAGPLEEVRLPPGLADALRDTYTVIQSCETAAVHADRLAGAPELFDPEVLERLRVAMEVPGWRYIRAMDGRARLAEAAGALFDRHDVLALPTVPIIAPPLGVRETEIGGRPAAVRAALLALTSPWNVLGRPALTVPAGTVDGLPVGLQLVGRPGHEALIFEAARTLGRHAGARS